MNKVEWELEGTTNVDQVVDKTNKGLNGIEKNAKRINDAFGNSLSSFFLKFLGPMALLQIAISNITESMQKAKQTAEDGFNTLASGEDKYSSATQSRMAAFYKNREDEEKAKEQSAAGRKAATEKFMDDRGFWAGMWERPISTFAAIMGEFGIGPGAGAEWIQKTAEADFEAANKDAQKAGAGNVTQLYKASEGFGNVVGVGASPVLEAMTQQSEIQRQMLVQLEIANANKGNDTDFTKGDEYQPYGM